MMAAVDVEKLGTWSSLLTEVRAPTVKQDCGVIVFGEYESGKSSLINALNPRGPKLVKPVVTPPLDFFHLPIRDEDSDDHTRMRAWVLDGDPRLTHLLRFALNKESFDRRVAVLVVSMSEPWLIPEILRKWTAILSDHIDMMKMAPDVMKVHEENRKCATLDGCSAVAVSRRFQEYLEPGDALRRSGEEQLVTRLSESTLTQNMGIPMIVVVTKVDVMPNLEKEHELRNEHFDYIQQYLRKFCLHHGAALVYTSAKDGKNCTLLNHYLLHLLYSMPFAFPASVIERDSVFVPIGWDNDKKIGIVCEGLAFVNDPFHDVIKKPLVRKAYQREEEIVVDDDQSFMRKMMELLAKAAPTAQEPPPPVSIPAQPSVGARDKTNRNAPGNEGAVANFFMSLLNKKPGSSPGTTGSPTPGNRAAVRSEAAAALERMSKEKDAEDSS